jgi:hypothetical protein
MHFKTSKSTLYTVSGDALKSNVSPGPGAESANGENFAHGDTYALLPLTFLILLDEGMTPRVLDIGLPAKAQEQDGHSKPKKFKTN